ncbi:hypothetical protein MSG28_004510 [Choristoneura fumiferana]|uniref:Uncharacterized protein n=1 Tax=Choristoneura fumiferana TaxID=7141 RepID=A0ACC0K663_CHOFU|nr:hypothetical protein MSG28_004510 [Choristoneura fumiferana]
MDLKLRREAPVFKRCCFCIPLRRGLIGWGYAKLLLNILTICYIIFIMLLVFFFLPIKYISIYIAVVVSIMIDVAFTGLLIIACHKVYVILLTRSEAIKLHNQSLEMQFVNNAAEAEARCVPAEQRKTEPYTDEKYSAPYTENGHDSSEHGVY